MNNSQKMNRRRLVLAAACSLACGVHAQQAQVTWTNKPLRLVVGGPAGGTADMLARLLAEGLYQKLGKVVIVESKPGAAGALAINDLISSGKDGSTFLVGQGGFVSETPLAYKVHYQPFKDIKPLAQLSRTALVLVANKDFPVNNLQQLADYGKAQKDGVMFASYATGMRAHTSGVLLGQLMGITMKHVGYKGSPPALTDLMGGHVPLAMDGVLTSLPLIKAGKIKPLAVNYPTRISELPDVPTFKELGYPRLSEAGWMGVWSRPDAPLEAQQVIRDVSLKFFAQPEIQKKVREIGMEPAGSATSEELVAGLREESKRQAELLKSIDYQPQ
ncbi:tripartite tricarboxylate transporter substrate binding protein [Acidovorax sp. Be4]|uniref:Tripartite tricarboxylate transporter substrate binding protein n=1 Tax=Acidovorax bellezanensis TaxID=2976702 RepID=A0ABT2PMF7_9BURK|nr:tripartite tricarboxylate transporter substrate binding protein [Acidovorax sp. Be4]MCT9810452.1 tripartite tricarboxylate transporter substrate binding protein [Acidovorax sp. Be4]